MFKKISTLVLIASFLSSPSQAAYLFSPAVTYFQQTVDDGVNPAVDSKITVIDVRLGYIFDMGLYIGGLYSLHDYDNVANSSDSYFGPSVGYYWKNLFVAGTWYVYGERDLTSGLGKYSGANGYQVDVSYTVPLSETVSIGPQITYRNVKFDDLQISGNSSSANYKFSGITPYFALNFIF